MPIAVAAFFGCGVGDETNTGNSVEGTTLNDRVVSWQFDKPVHKLSLPPANFSVLRIAFSPDDSQLISSHMVGVCKIWNTESGELEKTLKGHQDHVYGVDFSRNGQQAISWSMDRTVRFWETKTGKEFRKSTVGSGFGGLVSFNPVGQTIALTSDSVRVFDVESEKQLFKYEGENDFNSLTYSSDGKRLFVVQEKTKLVLLDALTGDELKVVEAKGCYNGALSPDGKVAASVHGDGIHIWDVASGSELHVIDHRGVIMVAFSPDGSLLASADYADKTVSIWVTSGWKKLRTLDGHKGNPNKVMFSHDGRLLASADIDTVWIWKAPSED
jgi:WD40 repeat protein